MEDVVIRVKRGRDEEVLDDFVLREEVGLRDELASQMNRVALDGPAKDPDAVAKPSARRFRRVGTVTEEEAEALLHEPGAMERRVREFVKDASVSALANSGRSEAKQRDRVKGSRSLCFSKSNHLTTSLPVFTSESSAAASREALWVPAGARRRVFGTQAHPRRRSRWGDSVQWAGPQAGQPLAGWTRRGRRR